MRAYYTTKDKRKYGDMSYESKYLLDPKYMTKRDLQHYYRYYNMTKNRGQFKKIVIIIFCVCVFSYLFVDYNLRTKLLRLRDRFDFIARVDDEYNMTQAYFINTSGCRMPYFEVFDDNIAQFMVKPRPYTCTKPLIRASNLQLGQLELNVNASELFHIYKTRDLDTLSCQYAEVTHESDTSNKYARNATFKLQKRVQLPKDMEFIYVECQNPQHKVIYKDFHFFAVPKPSQKLRKTRKSTLNRTQTQAEEQERLSVMVLGLDSVSHLNFQRQMRRSAAYVKQELSHVEFWGFNKVGDNTFPNLVPLLSGLDDQELNISCQAPLAVPSYDGCSFIWKRFHHAGYRTVFAEDVAKLGLFHYCRSGFHQPPTDYYLRPIMFEMEKHIAYKKELNLYLCMGGRRTADVLLEYMRKLVPRMQKELFFSFFWSVGLTHDHFNWPMLLDAQLESYLRQLQDTGVLNRTVVLLMADHGMRWGTFRKTYQGMMEDRLPLLIALYPAWLKKRYPLAVANLELNAKRLITPFDLHATMLQLLDMSKLEADELQRSAAELKDIDSTLPRGISLFLPVPEERNCEQAGIAAHWCTCHKREELPTNDNRVQRAARYLVRLVNERLAAHPQCRTLYLNSILQAFIAAPHNKIVKELNTDFSVDITLRLQTKPGLAVFESTVRMSGYASALTGTISRINLYGSQSYCVQDSALKMFCYCHR